MYRTRVAEKEWQRQFGGVRDNHRSEVFVPPLLGHPLLRLQKTIGNQAVGRLMQRCQDGHLSSKHAIGSKISGSGTGTVAITYKPEAKDKSTKIVFLQTIRVLLDGMPCKPSKIDSTLSYKDPDTTKAFHYVDYLKGEKDPYYNGDDPQDSGTQGNAVSSPKVDATMSDTPYYPDSSFPKGSKKTTWEFKTAAFSATGKDKGTYYEYIDWTYEKEKGKTDKTAIGSKGTRNPGKSFTDAVSLWCKNHGFKLP